MAGAPHLALTLALPCLALAQTSPSVTSSNPSNSTDPTGGGGLSVPVQAALGALGALAVLALLVLLVLLGLRLRERRRTEGSYRPSREEQAGARGGPQNPPLRLPPEERLI
ncbi:protein crumbs homolog 3 [Patagioenas fasciata]|uniref:protein crumbs homolog 3 n=1 Tax=Patagioenas fasciata TaxID=372321 RepID=UPI003A99AD90